MGVEKIGSCAADDEQIAKYVDRFVAKAQDVASSVSSWKAAITKREHAAWQARMVRQAELLAPRRGTADAVAFEQYARAQLEATKAKAESAAGVVDAINAQVVGTISLAGVAVKSIAMVARSPRCIGPELESAASTIGGMLVSPLNEGENVPQYGHDDLAPRAPIQANADTGTVRSRNWELGFLAASIFGPVTRFGPFRFGSLRKVGTKYWVNGVGVGNIGLSENKLKMVKLLSKGRRTAAVENDLHNSVVRELVNRADEIIPLLEGLGYGTDRILFSSSARGEVLAWEWAGDAIHWPKVNLHDFQSGAEVVDALIAALKRTPGRAPSTWY